jgi:hypothetical protein
LLAQPHQRTKDTAHVEIESIAPESVMLLRTIAVSIPALKRVLAKP